MKTSMKQLKSADWNQLESDVLMRIRWLHAVVKHSSDDPVNDAIAEDLILPAITMLSEFCALITPEEDSE
jgi:hypothetical protein